MRENPLSYVIVVSFFDFKRHVLSLSVGISWKDWGSYPQRVVGENNRAKCRREELKYRNNPSRASHQPYSTSTVIFIPNITQEGRTRSRSLSLRRRGEGPSSLRPRRFRAAAESFLVGKMVNRTVCAHQEFTRSTLSAQLTVVRRQRKEMRSVAFAESCRRRRRPVVRGEDSPIS